MVDEGGYRIVEEERARATKVRFLLEIQTPYRDDFLARLAREVSFDVSILYCAGSEPWREWKLESSPAYATSLLRGASIGGRKGGFNAKLNPSVWSALTTAEPDLVVIGGYALPTNQLAMLWCRAHAVPYLLLWESHDLGRRSLRRRALGWAPSRWSVRGSAGVLAASSNARRRLLRLGLAPKRVSVLPNAPDVRALAASSDSEPPSPDWRIGTPSFLFIGRLIHSKGVDTLLSAFHLVQKELPNAGLLLIGSGPLEADLRRRSAELGLVNVSFRGFMQPNELPGVYAASDVFVLPSREEPYGVVVIEAMACGVPVVLSDMVGCGVDLVDETSGLVVRAGDAEGLAEALISLGGNPERRASLGAGARAAAFRWDLDYCVDTFRHATAMALAGPPSSKKS